MMNKYWSFVSTYYLVVIIILYVGYIPTATAIIGETCTSDGIEETTRVTVNVKEKEWVPGGPKISVEIVTQGSPIKNIQVWAEPINESTHIGSWSPMTGHEYVDGCGSADATITNHDELDLSQITYEWNPPSVEDQETPTQETPNQETSTQETPNQETSTQETPNQETSTQKTPNQETPTQETPNQETPTQETPNQETPTQETQNQETPTQSSYDQYDSYNDNESSVILPCPTTTVDSADHQDEQDEYVFAIASATFTIKVIPTGSSFIARHEIIEDSTPLDGPIVFKGVVQFEDSSYGEFYSFKSDNIPISNGTTPNNDIPNSNGTTLNNDIPNSNGTTSNNDIPNSNGTNNGEIPYINDEKDHITNIDNEYPESSPFSATNSKFIFKGFNLFFILTLSGGFLVYFSSFMNV